MQWQQLELGGQQLELSGQWLYHPVEAFDNSNIFLNWDKNTQNLDFLQTDYAKKKNQFGSTEMFQLI